MKYEIPKLIITKFQTYESLSQVPVTDVPEYSFCQYEQYCTSEPASPSVSSTLFTL